MPNLTQQGGNIRVFNNKVIANNTDNFGAKGTPVASVPAGSGMVVNANDDVEIFDNEIADNDTANFIISSCYSTGYKDSSMAKDFDPYPERIYVHGNSVSGGGDSPDGLDLKTLKVAMYGLGGRFPDVLWDGYDNKDRKVDGKPAGGPQICLRDVKRRAQCRWPGRLQESEQGRQAVRMRPAAPAGGGPGPRLSRTDDAVARLLCLGWCLLLLLAGVQARRRRRCISSPKASPGHLSEWHVLKVEDGRLT